MRKGKKAGKNRNVLALLVIFVLIVVVGFELIQVYGDLSAKRAEENASAQQLEELQQKNASLQADLDRSDDPSFYEELAREQLGLAQEGERIFYDVNN